MSAILWRVSEVEEYKINMAVYKGGGHDGGWRGAVYTSAIILVW